MCDPISATLAVVGVASSVSQYQGQKKQAQQQQRYQAQAAGAERQRFLQEQSALRMRQAQEQEAMNRELYNKSIEEMERESRNVVAGKGMTGRSESWVSNDLIREWLNYSTAVTRQQELQNVNTGLALTDAGFRTQMNQIGINKSIKKPSFGKFLVGAVRGGVEGHQTGMQIKKAMGGSSYSSMPKGATYLPKTNQYTDPYYS